MTEFNFERLFNDPDLHNLREFCREPPAEAPEPGLGQIPGEQRVRDFLAEICGALWASAGVAGCSIRDKGTTWVAIAEADGRAAILFVTERADGQMVVTALPY